MSSILSQLKTMTTVVADTGDLASIKQFRPHDVTTNPTLLTTAVRQESTRELVKQSLRKAQLEAGRGAQAETIVDLATDHLGVDFGIHILDLVPGRVSTELDPRLSYDTTASATKARRLIHLYQKAGVPKERILIKIASTYPGIKAAQQLEQEGIHCNMTLLFSLNQAVAAAEAKATLISPFVGRILDWYKKHTGKESYIPAEDPGVISVTQIYQYLKHFDYPTEIMGASFRNADEIIQLAGCDLLTISPFLLAELDQKPGTLEQKLSSAKAKQATVQRLENPLDEAAFQRRHQRDAMAKEKLDEGIQGFTKDLLELRTHLLELLRSTVNL